MKKTRRGEMKAMNPYKAFQTRTMPVIRTICGRLLPMASVVLVGCDKEPVFITIECPALHAIHPSTRQIIREEFGLVNMTIDIPEAEVEYQSAKFKNIVSFEDALRSALKSFMEDGTDSASPLGQIFDDYYGESEKRQKEILFEYMNRSDTYLELVSSDEGIESAEGGESTKENWIFYLRITSYAYTLQWAIADRSGKNPTYNYGFN